MVHLLPYLPKVITKILWHPNKMQYHMISVPKEYALIYFWFHKG